MGLWPFGTDAIWACASPQQSTNPLRRRYCGARSTAGHHKAGVNLGILHWHPESVALAKMPEAERRRIAVELWTKAAEADVPEARDCLRQAQDVWKA